MNPSLLRSCCWDLPFFDAKLDLLSFMQDMMDGKGEGFGEKREREKEKDDGETYVGQSTISTPADLWFVDVDEDSRVA